MVTAPTPPLPSNLLRNRNFMLLWAAYGISAVGDHLSEMALLQTAGGFQRDDVTRVQALMTFCFFAPFVCLGPLAGWWADRFSRKWTMFGADLIRAAIMLSIPVVVPVLLAHGLSDFGVTFPLILTGALAAFFSPARQALVPTLIRDDQLVRANALISALGTIGAILSAIIGGALVDLSLVGHLHLDWNYRLDALTFVVSAALVAGIAMSRSRAVPHTLPAGVWTPLQEGFRYVRDHRRVWQIILLGTVFWAAAGVVISVVPALVRDVFGGQFSEAGMYRGLIAAGLAMGAAILTLIGPAFRVSLVVLAAVCGAALWTWILAATCALQLGRILTALCLFLIGVHGAGILVAVIVVIQRFVPDARRGRVFGVSDMCTMAAIVATTGLLGLPHIPHLDRYIPVLLGLTGAGVLLTGVAAWRVYRHGSEHGPIVWLALELVRFYAAFRYRVRRAGICTVPRTGPVLVVACGAEDLVPLSVLATCPHRVVRFLVRPGSCRGLTSALLRLGGAVADEAVIDAADAADARQRRRDGDCLGVLLSDVGAGPPHARSDLLDLAVSLVLRCGVVVIPCRISRVGTRGEETPGRERFGNTRVQYGPPVDLAFLCSPDAGADAGRQAATRIAQAIHTLEVQDMAS
jgi:MFS family permease